MLRTRIFLLFAVFLTVSALSVAQSLPSGPSSYSVTLRGQSAGKVSAAITPTSNGYNLTARAKLQLDTTQFAFSRDGAVNQQLNLTKESLSGTVNGSAVLFNVSAANGKYSIQISANGKQYTNTLDQHPHTVFLPDLDPVALQQLATEMVANSDLWVLIPKQTGLLYPVKVENKAQEKGTLNGQSIPVVHKTATINGQAYEVFTSGTGLLVQVEIPQQGFALIRDGFQLRPSAGNPGAAGKPSSN